MHNFFRNKKILVTGGLGFIGSNLAIRLVEAGAKVTILDSMIPEYGGNLANIEPVKNNLQINFSDMRDPHTIPFLVKDMDYIFNLAGQVSHLDSMQTPLVDLDINVRAQVTLLEACRLHNPKVILAFASTRQFYGSPQYVPVDEKHPLNPPDVNGINKLAGEQYHLLYNRVHGLRITALRMTNTYGPRQMIKNARQGFIGWFVNRCLLNQPILLYDGGHQIRDFCYVDDVVEALLLSVITPECYGKVFNLSGEKSSLVDLAKLMILKSGRGYLESTPFPKERKKIDIGDFYGTSRLFNSITGWENRISLEVGLEKVFSYYKSNLKLYVENDHESLK